MVSGKALIKYFLAGGLGIGVLNILYRIPYLGSFIGYLTLPYPASLIFNVLTGISTLIIGLILDLVWKD